MQERGSNSFRSIERALIDQPMVDDCLVTMQLEGKRRILCAYLVTFGRLDLPQLENRLRVAVPSAEQLPDKYVFVSHLPRSEDGSLDSAAVANIPGYSSATWRGWIAQFEAMPEVVQAQLHLAQYNAPPEKHAAPAWTRTRRWSRPGGASSDADRNCPATPTEPATFEPGTPAISRGPRLVREVDFPDNLGDALERASLQGEGSGLIHLNPDGNPLKESYKDLAARAGRIHGALAGQGLQPGDPVLLQLESSYEFLGAFWGAVLGGFVPVPVSIAPTYEDPSNAVLAKLRNAWRLLDEPPVITNSQLLESLTSIVGKLDMSTALILDIKTLVAHEPAPERHNALAEDTALMLLTSGSTGMPKCVTLSHRNVLCRSAAEARFASLTADDVSLNWMAMDHVAGIVYFHIRDVYLGCLQIQGSVEEVLQNPLTWLDWVDSYRVTLSFAPNFAFGLVNRHANDIAKSSWDLSCLRWIWNGGEAIVAKTARRFVSLLLQHGLPETAMRPAWGMSETSSAVTGSNRFTLELTSDDDPLVEVGEPFPGFEMRITDGAQVIDEGQIGQLEVRGESVTAGYFNNPAVNKESFTPDGWFRTGDLGFIENGRLTMSGRQKDEIVVNGVNYHSHDIEAIVEELDAVDTSFTAACGVRRPDADTDVLAIFFHPVDDSNQDAADIARSIRQRVVKGIGVVASFVIPLQRHEIPKTAIGKIQRTKLAEQFESGQYDSLAIAAGSEVDNSLPNWFFKPVWRRCEASRQDRQLPQCLMLRAGDSATDSGSSRLSEAFRARQINLSDFAQESILPECLLIIAADNAKQESPLSSADTTTLNALLVALNSLKAIATSAPPQKDVEVVLISHTIRNVLADDSPSPDLRAAIAALKSAAQEIPWLRYRTIDLDATEVEHQVSAIEEEMRSAIPPDCEIAFRGGERYVSGLQPLSWTGIAEAPRAIGRNALYMLTGGLGGIAYELARVLIEQFDSRIALLGRHSLSELSDEQKQRLEHLDAIGECAYERADVANADELQSAIEKLNTRFGAELDGVIHCAGVFEELSIDELDQESLARATDAKIVGAVNLHAALSSRPESLFVAISSANGFFGGHSVAAYSAANAYLDAFSERRRAAGFKNSFSLAWSLWDEVGMSRGYERKSLSRARGYWAISRNEGKLSFLIALALDEPHVLIGLDINNSNIRRLTAEPPMIGSSLVADLKIDDATQLSELELPDLIDESGRAVTCEPRAIRSEDADVSTESSRATKRMEESVVAVWSDVLGVSSVGGNDNFFDLGGDSLRVTQLAGALSTLANRKVLPRDIFHYPTARALAGFLAESASSQGDSQLSRSASRGEKRRARQASRRKRRN